METITIHNYSTMQVKHYPAKRSKPPKMYRTKAEKKAMKRHHVRILKMRQAMQNAIVPVTFAS